MPESVSVIVPTYNREKLLPSAIESILEQTYPYIEIIVVNDGSSDNTDEVIKPYLGRITYIKRENGGCAAAKNTGLQVASGDYITHLDDDDLMLPQRIERLVDKFSENPRIGLCSTSAYLIDENDRVIKIKQMKPVPAKTRLLDLLLGRVSVQSNMMLKREVQEEVGWYTSTILEDYDMWLRVARRAEIGAIPEPLVKYRQHANQITSPENHTRLLQAGQRITLEFLQRVPLNEIAGRALSTVEAHILLGMIMHRRKLYKFAHKHFQKAMPSYIACFWLGILNLYCRNYKFARQYFIKAYPDNELASSTEDAIKLIERVKKLSVKKAAKDNNDPDVVQLRKDLSELCNRALEYALKIKKGKRENEKTGKRDKNWNLF